MTQAIHTAIDLTYPEPITNNRIDFLINNKNITPSVAKLDLEMVKMKLQEKDEGLNWTSEQCESAEIEYKRCLHLCIKHGKGVVPNRIMDYMWHFHILDTRSYVKDCDELFGGYMHHYPYFGMRGDNDAKDLENSFYKTKDLYLDSFGEEIAREEHSQCWHDCENRCHNACPSIDAITTN